jgi:hypothetical protein
MRALAIGEFGAEGGEIKLPASGRHLWQVEQLVKLWIL